MNSDDDSQEEDGVSKLEWGVCLSCSGEGRVSRRASKRSRLRHKLAQIESGNDSPAVAPRHVERCSDCKGSGLVKSALAPQCERDFPSVAIVGAGLGGLALAVACRHRGIPFMVYERDEYFDERSQGYGLTMQQASQALECFGIFDLEGGITSTKHVVHTPDGEVMGEWGLRKWGRPEAKAQPKRQNVHIARQALRHVLLQALGGSDKVQWGHQFTNFHEDKDRVDLTFKVGAEEKQVSADIVVGADGIRSEVRAQLLGDLATPLQYLDCIVILGICPLENIGLAGDPLLNGETVFQTANGHERIYVMPYSSGSVMWQLSFPLSEDEAKELNRQGSQALRDEAIRRCPWHDPIPQILKGTDMSLVTGYPVYDRALLSTELLPKASRVTLLGDAAHPMSPFKGQGANQALLDALSLARVLYKESSGDDADLEKALRGFENKMLTRSAVKVKASAEAARFLHTDVATCRGNMTRGAVAHSEPTG